MGDDMDMSVDTAPDTSDTGSDTAYDVGADDIDTVADIPDEITEDVSSGTASDTGLDDATDVPEDMPEDVESDTASDMGVDEATDLPEDMPEDVELDAASDTGVDDAADVPEDVPEDVELDAASDTGMDDLPEMPDEIPEDVVSITDNDMNGDDMSAEEADEYTEKEPEVTNETEEDAQNELTDETAEKENQEYTENEPEISGEQGNDRWDDLTDDEAGKTEDTEEENDEMKGEERETDESDQDTEETRQETEEKVQETEELEDESDKTGQETKEPEEESDETRQETEETGNEFAEEEKPEANDSELGEYTEAADDVHNPNTRQDIANAFDFVDREYEHDSATWHEAASRRLESLGEQKAELETEVPKAEEKLNQTCQEMETYLESHPMTVEEMETDAEYQRMKADAQSEQAEYESLRQQQSLCGARLDDLNSSIDPEMKTTFRGMGDSDFRDGYEGFITGEQGTARADMKGVCGIDETCSIVNQQTGSRLTEADGVQEYTGKGLCDIGYEDPNRNGGTNATQRAQFLNDHGLTYERTEGIHGIEDVIKLEDMAQRFRNGESAGVVLRGEDLAQAGLADRGWRMPTSEEAIEWNKTRNNANHATTVAGFSYYGNGQIAGVWLNDTGGYAGSNRVYLDAEKFAAMQQKTKGFAVEYSKKR